MTKQKESAIKKKAKHILGELSCFIYRSDAHYDRENYKHDLDIIEKLLHQDIKRYKNAI